jgi:hypothetical protein
MNAMIKILVAVISLISIFCLFGCACGTLSPTTSTTLLATSTGTPNQGPVAVVSVSAVGPPNPGGPRIEIVLKNTGIEPVVFINAVLKLEGEKTFVYNFPDVSAARPLQPDEVASQTLNLVGPTGYSDEIFYPLMINVTFLSGETFSYIKHIKVS